MSITTKLSRFLSVGALLAAPIAAADAAVITSLPGGVALSTSVSANATTGPITTQPGVTFSATNDGYLNYTGGWGFGGNPVWAYTGAPMDALNSSAGTISFSFAAPISAFLAQFDWSPGYNITIAAYDANNTLLDSLALDSPSGNLVTPTGYYGFQEVSATISKVTMTNGYVIFRDATISQASSAVPEPASWGMMMMGFGVIGFALRRRPAKAVRFG